MLYAWYAVTSSMERAWAHPCRPLKGAYVVCNSGVIRLNVICVDFSNIIWGDSHQLRDFPGLSDPKEQKSHFRGTSCPLLGGGCSAILSMCGHSVGLSLPSVWQQIPSIQKSKASPGAVVLTPPTTT